MCCSTPSFTPASSLPLADSVAGRPWGSTSSCSLPGLGSEAFSSGQRSRSALERRSPSLAACSLALPWLLSPCSALKPLSVHRRDLFHQHREGRGVHFCILEAL